MFAFFNKVEEEQIDTDNFGVETLSVVESAPQLLAESGVTTVTFFSGSNPETIKDVITSIRNRTRDVLRANPWMVGKVVKTRDSKQLKLVYPKEVSDEVLDRVFVVAKESPRAIHSNTPYEDMYDSVVKESAMIPSGKSCVNKDILVTKITIVPHHESSSFALIMSMSHTVADGHTYYRILSMLSAATPVEEMNATRKADLNPLKDAWCSDDWNYVTTNLGFILNLTYGYLFGPKAKCYAFHVDDEKIKLIKKEVSTKNTDKFVSTNDILVSNMSTVTKPRLQTMAINFRGRVAGAKDNDAGNLEAIVVLDAGSYGSPSAIRNAVQEYNNDATKTGRSSELPSVWESLRTQPLLGQLSNWAGFFDVIEIEDTGWKQELHLPIIDIKHIPIDCAVIFRPQHGKTAIMYICPSPEYQSVDFWQKNSPVGKLVSSTVFGV